MDDDSYYKIISSVRTNNSWVWIICFDAMEAEYVTSYAIQYGMN